MPSRFPNGWYYLNLQNTTVPAGALSAGQAFLTIRTQLNGNEGLFSAGWDGTQLDGQCATAIVPVPATLQSANPSEPVAP